MKSELRIITSDQLAAHAHWIGLLARELISDPHTAEDLAQATLVRALEKGPREPAALRSWLKRVLRNLLYEKLRTHRNREAREAATIDIERDSAATDDVVERMQTEERLTAALQALDEPFRSTLFLRFYDDLAPREIASRQNVSVATVKSRLHRGLTRLRACLDDEYDGDRQAWMSGLLPLAGTAPLPLAPAALPLGGLAMNLKAAVIACTLALAGGIYVALKKVEETERVTLAEATAEPKTASASVGSGAPRRKAGEQKERRSLSGVSPKRAARVQTEPPPAAALTSIRGQIFDGEGAPLGAMELRIRGEEEVVGVSEPSGSFEFETALARGDIEAAASEWVTVRSGLFDQRTNLPPVIVAAPVVSLGGRVVDEWGAGLESARITVTMPENFERRFPVRLDSSSLERFVETAKEGGAFALPEVPFIIGSVLHATHPGYEPLALPIDGVSNEALVLELSSPIVPEDRAIRGVVLRQDGTPATEAHVSLGASTVPTSETGEFTIDRARVLEGDRIVAIEKGSRPAVLEATGPSFETWPDPVVLNLGGSPLSLAGVVLNAAGEPLAEARVWIDDGTSFGVFGNVPLQREALMAGAPLPTEGIDFLGTAPEEDGEGDFSNHMPLSAPNAILNYVTTDAEGRFELPGLEDRDYTLHVLGPQLASGTTRENLRAGEKNLVLRVDPELVHPRLKGRVELANGEAVAGVLIYPYLSVVQDQIRILGGSSGVSRWFAGPPQTTDSEGRFELGPILNRGVSFYIESGEILPTYGSIEEVSNPESHVFEVVARLHAIAELLDPQLADELAVFDSGGDQLMLRTMRASGHTTWERIPFDGGRTGAFVLTSEAVELRLYKNGEVIGSHPLNLQLGELNELRY